MSPQELNQRIEFEQRRSQNLTVILQFIVISLAHMILLRYTGGSLVRLISNLFVHNSKVRTRAPYYSQQCHNFDIDAKPHAKGAYYTSISVAHPSPFPFSYMNFLSCDIVEIRLQFVSTLMRMRPLTRRHPPCLTGAFPSPKSAHPPYLHLS